MEEDILLNPGSNEIRLKLVSIETPMGRDVAIAKYSLFASGFNIGETWRTLTTINVEIHLPRSSSSEVPDFARIKADAEEFLKAQFVRIGETL